MHNLATTQVNAQPTQEERDCEQFNAAYVGKILRQLQILVKHQGEELVALRDALRKATMSPIWIAPNKDEDM